MLSAALTPSKRLPTDRLLTVDVLISTRASGTGNIRHSIAEAIHVAENIPID